MSKRNVDRTQSVKLQLRASPNQGGHPWRDGVAVSSFVAPGVNQEYGFRSTRKPLRPTAEVLGTACIALEMAYFLRIGMDTTD